MKDPLAGYFFGGGNVGFRQKSAPQTAPPTVGGQAGQAVGTPSTPFDAQQPAIPSPSNDAVPAPPTGSDEDVSDRDDERSVDVFSDQFDSRPAAGRLQDDLSNLGLSQSWSSKVADFIDPFDKVRETPGISNEGGYGGLTGNQHYGLAATHGQAQGISQTKQDLGWDLTAYGSLLGGYGILPGQGLAKRAGGALLDSQIENIDDSFDALDDDLTGYDAKGLDDMVTISDAYGNVHQMTKGQYEAQQGLAGSASLAADVNAGNRTTTTDVNGQTVSTTTDIWGNPSSFVDANGDGVQQSNERSVVTSADGTAVTSGSGNVVTSRSTDEIEGYTGNTAMPGSAFTDFDMTTFDDIANDAEWGGGDDTYGGWG